MPIPRRTVAPAPRPVAPGCKPHTHADTAVAIAELRAEIAAMKDEIWEMQANSHGHQPGEVARTLNARLTALESKPGIEGPQGPPGESITGPRGIEGPAGPPGATAQVDEPAEQDNQRIEGSLVITVEPITPATSR